MERGVVFIDDREVWVRAYPLPIDYEATRRAGRARPRRASSRSKLLARRRDFSILRVDRADLSKNILRGFTGFDIFLEQHPEYAERITFTAQLMPSRTDVPEYAEYLERIEALVAVVNHRHGTPDWMPIDLKLRDDLEEAVASYKHYDVIMVNAMFDGMNLVAKEAALVNARDGVSILSENTGAHEELGEFSLTVNPFDVQELADSIYAALTMDADERARRAAGLKEILVSRDPGDWVDEQVARHPPQGAGRGRAVGRPGPRPARERLSPAAPIRAMTLEPNSGRRRAAGRRDGRRRGRGGCGTAAAEAPAGAATGAGGAVGGRGAVATVLHRRRPVGVWHPSARSAARPFRAAVGLRRRGVGRRRPAARGPPTAGSTAALPPAPTRRRHARRGSGASSGQATTSPEDARRRRSRDRDVGPPHTSEHVRPRSRGGGSAPVLPCSAAWPGKRPSTTSPSCSTPSRTTSVATKIIVDVETLIDKHGGSLVGRHDWGVRQTAFEVRKQGRARTTT